MILSTFKIVVLFKILMLRSTVGVNPGKLRSKSSLDPIGHIEILVSKTNRML